MEKIVKPAYSDPQNSVDLFDAHRKNDFGEMFCVAPAILYSQVNEYWYNYQTEIMSYGLINPDPNCEPDD